MNNKIKTTAGTGDAKPGPTSNLPFSSFSNGDNWEPRGNHAVTESFVVLGNSLRFCSAMRGDGPLGAVNMLCGKHITLTISAS